MEERKDALTVGIGAIVLSIVIRVVSAAQPVLPLKDLLLWPMRPRPQIQQMPETTAPSSPETEPESIPPSVQTQVPVFRPEDGETVQLNDLVEYEPDVQTLLLSPLQWQLCTDEPTVLILHTHATESYTRQPWEDYAEDSDYRTLNGAYNMLSIGQALAEVLEQGGISVIHDRMLHDYPSYDGSYEHARESIEAYLAAYPSICMVIDLHRDALDFENDPQLTTVAQVNGKRAAQLMLVAGTDENLFYPGWRDNLSLGVKLTALLERNHPGITRPIQLRAQRFNLDMTPGSLLVEVGANGNTHDEAILAAQALGEAIVELANGANLQDAPPF